LTWTVSSSAHSDNLKLTKTPKPIKMGLFTKNPRLTPKKPNQIKPSGWALKTIFFQPAVNTAGKTYLGIHRKMRRDQVTTCWEIC